MHSKVKDLWLQPTTPCPPSVTVVESCWLSCHGQGKVPADGEKAQRASRGTWAMSGAMNKFIAIMGNQEVARNIASLPPVSPPIVTTTLQASRPSRVKPVILMEIECKGAPSSCPVSCTFHSQHWTLLTSRWASTGHYHTSRVDVRRASPNASYDRSYGQERCALHHKATSPGNSRQRSAQRTRQLWCSCG
jgi:hypothetical protein